MKPYFKAKGEFDPKKPSTVETLRTCSAKRILRAGKKRSRASGKKDAKHQLDEHEMGSPVPETPNYPILESASLAFMTRSGRRTLKKASKHTDTART